MAPIFYDLGRSKLKVWAFLGWASREIWVDFARPPEARILELNGEPARGNPTISWQALRARIAYPVTAELYVNRLLDRGEFRSLCDSCGTQAEILRRLEA